MVLIDGHNVLHALRAFGPRGSARPALTHAEEIVELAVLLVRAKAFHKRHIVIVCDGSPPRGIAAAWPRVSEGPQASRVRLQFAGDDQEADDVLHNLLTQAQRPRDILLVSSDAKVLRDAAMVRAETLQSQKLIASLRSFALAGASEHDANAQGKPHADEPLGPLGVAAWLKFFAGEREPLTKKEKARQKPSTQKSPKANTESLLPPQRPAASKLISHPSSPYAAAQALQASTQVPSPLPAIDMEQVLREGPQPRQSPRISRPQLAATQKPSKRKKPARR